jgi:tripartite-type tricarboxylate transporter receptor subunit TctC
MQQVMTEDLGQPLVIDNRAGANGYIGTENVAKSAPDGYSLLATSVAVVAGPPVSRAPYDPVKDLTAITEMITTVGVLVAKNSLPVSTVRELIDYAKKNPGKLSYGSSGVGSAQHIDGEYFKLLTGTDIVHVPYKGGGPQVQAVVAQEVDFSWYPLQQIRQHLDSGKAKLIAMYDEQRYAAFPSTPSINETVPEYRRTPGWVGLFGPAGLPAPIVARINGAAVKALRTPSVKAKVEETAIVAATTADEFAKIVREDYARISKVVNELRARGVKFE